MLRSACLRLQTQMRSCKGVFAPTTLLWQLQQTFKKKKKEIIFAAIGSNQSDSEETLPFVIAAAQLVVS